MNHYVLIGAGGTGSILARPLLQYLMAQHRSDFSLDIIDDDAIEHGNLERQLFRPDAVGRMKAIELASSLPMRAQPICTRLDEANVADLIPEGSTVIIAADNFMVRRIVDSHVATLRDATVINPGNEDWTSTCQIHVRRHGRNLTPRISYMHDEIADAQPAEQGLHCGERLALGETQTIAANMMSAAWALSALAMVERVLRDQALTGLGQLSQDSLPWHELYVQIPQGKVGGPDWRIDGDGTWA